MEPKIVVIGSLNMDLIVKAPHMPKPGETIIGGDFSTASGGKGANQAVASARLGGQVAMVGCIGSDANGEALKTGLETDRIDTRCVRVDPERRTGVAFIIVEDSGQNSIVVSSGANWQVAREDIDRSEDVIRESDILVFQLEIPLETVEYAVDLAFEFKTPVVLNPAPARKLSPDLLKKIDYLILNETETAILTGIEVPDEASMRSAADKLHGMDVKAVIITLGSQGAFISANGEKKHVPAFRVKPVDTTAAGDAFVGGFSVAVASGKSIEEAVRFASAAGALATTKLGAQPSLPRLDEVESFIQRNSH